MVQVGEGEVQGRGETSHITTHYSHSWGMCIDSIVMYTVILVYMYVGASIFNR